MKCRSDLVRLLFLLAVSTTLFCLSSCRQNRPETLFRNVPSSSTGIDFVNQLTYSDSLTVLEFEYMFNGAGVALLDVNNDGLQDIFFAGNMVSCRLYLNKGNMKFEDITEKAGIKTTGWAYGVSVVDINNDGFQDIYICKAGNRRTKPNEMENIFFINNGNNTFTDRAKEMGLNDDGYDIQAAFFDYDKDGDLDMYLLKNAFVNYNRNNARMKSTEGEAPSTDKLFRNNGDLTFTDVSKEAGITIEGFGLGVSVCDLNNDNWPDLYVSNDFLTNDLVWINNRNGTFSNKASAMLRHQSYNGMGNDVADYNNDGLEDVMVVDMLPPDNKRWKLTMRGNTYEEFQNSLSFGYEPQYVRNTLQLNNGDGSFSEIGQLTGVYATEWSWAPLFADFDNDGYKDLFVSNGYRQDITNLDFIMYGKLALYMGTADAKRKERMTQLKKLPGIQLHNYLFANNHDLTFKDVSEEWGMDEKTFSNGAAYSDLDNDGDLDMVINNLDQKASVYENQSTKIHPEKAWLNVGFKGPDKNKNGLGAKVWIWQDSITQVNYFSPYRGYLSCMESHVHFGVRNKNIDSLKVVWPDGKSQVLNNVKPKQLLWVSYSDAVETPEINSVHIDTTKIFSSFNQSGIAYKHEEDHFVDFRVQPLLPHLLSHEGPGLAAGDVNGDGLEDLFAGAATDHKPSIFYQQKNGSFIKKEMPGSNNAADDMGSLLFDADNDGDLDLYVAAGGSSNQVKDGDTTFLHHLYINDGKGNFELLKEGLPEINTSAASVIAADYDRDGDLDLFVCGRVTPARYPLSPKSFLLRNDTKNGKCQFTNVTSSAGADLSEPGMVTSALWTDFDNDGWTDLILVGEFMPVRFFKNEKATFKEVTKETGLQHTNGWWNSIAAGDFDKDGDIDYVVGNLGLNSPYKASATQPVCIYASDFDKDGRLDPVMCHYVDGKEYPVASRDDMIRQMTPMRARFRTYDSYANVTFKEAFREDEISQAKVVKAERFESSYIENLGNGKFAIRSLPLIAQFSPVYGMLCNDFNNDGHLDVLCVGNSYATEVQTGRYDAQGSLLLRGDGKGNFYPDRKQLNVMGDNKSIVQLTGKDGQPLIVIGANSDSLKVFQLNHKLKQIPVTATETYAIITQKNGNHYRHELYYGNTYLSQSGRSLSLPGDVMKVEIYNNSGTKREINF
jgi:enediyne biosynthesis protein E4